MNAAGRTNSKETHDYAQAHFPLRPLHLVHARHRRLSKPELVRTNSKETYVMLKLTVRYARYILSTLATVGFGYNLGN